MKRRAQRRTCTQCGAVLSRVQLKPPVFACGACEPLRPMRRADAWAVDFERFYETVARELADPPGLLAKEKRPPWAYTSSHEILNVLINCYGLNPTTRGYYMVEAACVVAWRAAKAVYRLHPTLLQELLETPTSGTLPVEALLRLPVWAPYVECDLPVSWGCAPERRRVVGFYAYVDYVPLGPLVPVLRILLDVAHLDDPEPVPTDCCYLQLALEPGLTVEAALARVDEHMTERMDLIEAKHGPDVEVRRLAEELRNGLFVPDDFVTTVKRLISVLLYLCAENMEADARPTPAPARILHGPKGPRLGEAAAVQLIRCGQHAGEQLRRAREEHERARHAHRGGTVAPHVRAAHWHHFWRGPRDGARELVLRWLSPIFVGLSPGEAPPATTVRAVGP